VGSNPRVFPYGVLTSTSWNSSTIAGRICTLILVEIGQKHGTPYKNEQAFLTTYQHNSLNTCRSRKCSEKVAGHKTWRTAQTTTRIFNILTFFIWDRIFTENLLILQFYINIQLITDRLCGLVVRVIDYRSRGPGFDSRALQKVVGLERGPLSLVRTTKELLDRKVAAPV
jgi:hypothetical protein